MTVRKAVGGLPGISSVDADPETKRVVVSFEPSITKLTAIESKLAEEGYPVAK